MQGNSSQTASGTIDTDLGELVRCFEPACVVVLQADGEIDWAINRPEGDSGISYSPPDPVEIRMVQGDVLSATAAEERAVTVVATPYY